MSNLTAAGQLQMQSDVVRSSIGAPWAPCTMEFLVNLWGRINSHNQGARRIPSMKITEDTHRRLGVPSIITSS